MTMFYIQYTTRAEGDSWTREDETFETALDALEKRDVLNAEITNAQRCNYGPQYRVVDDDGKVYDYGGHWLRRSTTIE